MLASEYNQQWHERSPLQSSTICRVIDANGRSWSSEFATTVSTLDTALEMFMAACYATGEAKIIFPPVGKE